jgi:hypothetical protein
MTKKERDLVDLRTALLGGLSNWLPNNMRIFNNTGRMKGSEWCRFVRDAAQWAFEGVFEAKQQEALDHLLGLLALHHKMTNDVGDEDQTAAWYKLTIETMVYFLFT